MLSCLFSRSAGLLPVLLLAGCGHDPPPRSWSLLGTAFHPQWQSAGIEGSAGFKLKEDEITLDAGAPMTGVRFSGWQSSHLPLSDYALEFDAMRVRGSDFFAAVTFPVRRIDTCATLVIGGWGGGLVGVSSIDGQDASENATRSAQKFETNKWYHFRLEVRDDDLRGWLDGRIIINASIKARTISLRPGDIEHCAPFGLATYGTTGSVRGLCVRQL